jgi:hypothetical protein
VLEQEPLGYLDIDLEEELPADDLQPGFQIILPDLLEVLIAQEQGKDVVRIRSGT